MLDTLRNAGVPVRAAWSTSWQQLVREAPPQVLAKALGVSATTAVRHAERAGSDWTRYAADRPAARSWLYRPWLVWRALIHAAFSTHLERVRRYGW